MEIGYLSDRRHADLLRYNKLWAHTAAPIDRVIIVTPGLVEVCLGRRRIAGWLWRRDKLRDNARDVGSPWVRVDDRLIHGPVTLGWRRVIWRCMSYDTGRRKRI